PGKILHELRMGRVAAVGGSTPYYGSVDATPLYLMLAAETWRWTGDDGLMRELAPNLRAALAWSRRSSTSSTTTRWPVRCWPAAGPPRPWPPCTALSTASTASSCGGSGRP